MARILRIPDGFSFGLLERDTSRESDCTLLGLDDRPAFSMIPRSKWQPTNNRRLLWHVFAQKDGHCAANAAVAAVMALRERQGLKRVVLDPSRLYATHSRDGTGSTLAENLEAVSTIGCVPLAGEQQLWRGPRAYSQAEQEIARHYRVLEWIDCGGDFDRLACGLQAGFVGPIGSTKAFGGAHSVLAVDLIKIGSGWGLAGPNSWGPTWSEDGWYEGPESSFSDMDRYGCWVGTSAVIAEE